MASEKEESPRKATHTRSSNLSTLNRATIEQHLAKLQGNQDSIQSTSLWALHHKMDSAKIVQCWVDSFKRGSNDRRLSLLYLCNEILQTCLRKNAVQFKENFAEALKETIPLFRGEITSRVQHVLEVWEERGVYEPALVQEITQLLKKSSDSPDPQSTAALQDFSLEKLFKSLRQYSQSEFDSRTKDSALNLSTSDLNALEDLSSIRERSQAESLKGRFESLATRLQACIDPLERSNRQRPALLEQLEQSRIFYSEQYREVHVVTQAYKSFAKKVAAVKERLEAIANGTIPLAPAPAPVPVPVPVFESPASPSNFEGLDPTASFLGQPGEIDMEIESDSEETGGGGRHKHPRAAHRSASAGANPPDAQVARELEPGFAGAAAMNVPMMQQPITIPLVATQLQPSNLQNPFYSAMPGEWGFVGAQNGPPPAFAPNAMMAGPPMQMNSPPPYGMYPQPPMPQLYPPQMQMGVPPPYANPYQPGPGGYPMSFAPGPPQPGPIYTGAPHSAFVPHSAAPPPPQMPPTALPPTSMSYVNSSGYLSSAPANVLVSSAAAPPPASSAASLSQPPSGAATSTPVASTASKPSVHELIQRLLSKPNPQRASESSSAPTSSVSSLAANLVSTLSQAFASRAPPNLNQSQNQNQNSSPASGSAPPVADDGEHTPLTAESDPSAVHNQSAQWPVSVASASAPMAASTPAPTASSMTTWPRAPGPPGSSPPPPTAPVPERGPPLLGAAPTGYRPPAPPFNPMQPGSESAMLPPQPQPPMDLHPQPPTRFPQYSPSHPPPGAFGGPGPFDPYMSEAPEAGNEEYDPTMPPQEADFASDYQMKVRAFDNAMRQQSPARGSGNGHPFGKRRSFFDEPAEPANADLDMRTEAWMDNSPPNNGAHGDAPIEEGLANFEGYLDDEGPPPAAFSPRGAPGNRRPRGGREFRGGRRAHGGRGGGGGPRFGGPGPQFPGPNEFGPPEMMLDQPPFDQPPFDQPPFDQPPFDQPPFDQPFDAFGPPPPFFGGPPQQQFEYDPMMEQPAFVPRGPSHKMRMRPQRAHSPRHSAPFFRSMKQQF